MFRLCNVTTKAKYRLPHAKRTSDEVSSRAAAAATAVVVVDSGFTTLLTSQINSVAFYSERENSGQILLRCSNFGLRSFYVPYI